MQYDHPHVIFPMSKVVSHSFSCESLVFANNIVYMMIWFDTCWSSNGVSVLPRVRCITISQLIGNAVLVIASDVTMMKISTIITVIVSIGRVV